MVDKKPRIDPVSDPYTAAVAAELDSWMPPNIPVQPLALFRTLCRNVALSEAMRPLGEYQLSKRSRLSTRVRELVINATSARIGAEYEWGVHAVAYGAVAGLTDVDLANTVHGDAIDFDPVDGLVIAMVDELASTSRIAEGLWSQLSAVFSDEELLELIVLCGWYHIIGFVVNTVEVIPEPWAATFPNEAVAS